MTVPADWISLAEAARMTGSKSNVLRKHRINGWAADGLAVKDVHGAWQISPDVLATIKAVVPRAKREIAPGVPDDDVQSVLAELAVEDQIRLRAAVRELLEIQPVPWSAIVELARLGADWQGK